MNETLELTPDQQAAHYFLTELRTRILTQPLPYQYGIEARALESMWEIFAQARTAIQKYPGCEAFADKVTELLNVHLRPVTAKWHRPFIEGQLDSRDGADAFRKDLLDVQGIVREYADSFHQMAYGTPNPDQQTRSVLDLDSLASEFQALEYGIPIVENIESTFKLTNPFGQLKDTLIHAFAGRRHKITEALQFAPMNSAEAFEIQARRNQLNVTTAEGINAVGLALSGGGIRSATFSLGVVQVLADRKLLNQVDFLSTVSGGGYTGSFLSRWLGNGGPQSELAFPHGPDPEPIRYVRQHAKFLAAKNLKESWAMVSATLGGMLLNWSAPLFVITVAALVAILFDRYFPAQALLRQLFWVFSGLTGIALIAWGLSMRRERQSARVTGAILAATSAVTAIIGIFWTLNQGYSVSSGLYAWLRTHWTLSTSLGGLITISPAIIRFLPIFQDPKLRKLILQVLLWGAGLLAPMMALALFYALWHLKDLDIVGFPLTLMPDQPIGIYILGSIALLSGFIAFNVLNINLTGPHRFYRDGLARTFLQMPSPANPVVELNQINPQQTAPYHLINATLNLPSNQNAALQDRRCDFFLFTKHWMGAPSIGYFDTGRWQANGNPVDLATAIATSGAALSTHMGLGAMPTLTALLAFLNLRLGFWIKNPNIKSHFSQPGFSCLLREMLGVDMSEDKPWLNLSDGGHIENMAVYELLRRRCKFIICVDGEADPDCSFGGLMTLVRHAQIDFGIRIDPNLDEIRPNPQTGLSKAHAHLCRIHYPDKGQAKAGIGFLLYLKLSVTGNESELIKRYRKTHPDFPHQTTLDQFFDEEQFEAYRQLGVHVAEGLFSNTLMGSGAGPANVEDWFKRLAVNLLLPE